MTLAAPSPTAPAAVRTAQEAIDRADRRVAALRALHTTPQKLPVWGPSRRFYDAQRAQIPALIDAWLDLRTAATNLLTHGHHPLTGHAYNAAASAVDEAEVRYKHPTVRPVQ